MIPMTLHNLNCFADGRSLVGLVKTVEVPAFKVSMEEYRGGGMDIPVEIDVGMEMLTSKATFAEWNPDLFALFGLLGPDQKELVFRGSMERGNEVKPVIYTQRGTVKSTPAATWESGKIADAEFEWALRYAELSIDGQTLIKVDPENMIREINGVDQLANRRTALGL